LEIKDSFVLKWFFNDHDYVKPVVELISKEDLEEELMLKALLACSQILRVRPVTFGLARIPIRRVVELATAVDCYKVAIEAHAVLKRCLAIGHHDAVSDLSEHKYFSFVLDGIGDFAFNLREAAMGVCWKALAVARPRSKHF
jgi:hypothetical protein